MKMDGKKFNEFNKTCETSLSMKMRLLFCNFSFSFALLCLYLIYKTALIDQNFAGIFVFFIGFAGLLDEAIARLDYDCEDLALFNYNINKVMPSFAYMVFSVLLDFAVLTYMAVEMIGLMTLYKYSILTIIDIFHIVIIVIMIILFAVKFVTNLVSCIQYDMVYDDSDDEKEWEEVQNGNDREETIETCEEGDTESKKSENIGFRSSRNSDSEPDIGITGNSITDRSEFDK